MLIFLLLGAAALFLTLCFMNLRLAVAIFCGLLPTYLFRINLPIPTTFLEIAFACLFLVWLVTEAKSINRKAVERWIMPASLLLLGGTVGMLVSPDLRAAAGLWRAYFIEPMLFFVVFASVMRRSEDRRNALAFLGASLAVIAVSAVCQKMTGFGIPNPIWQAEETRRITSFYGFPNGVGLFAAPITVLMAGWTAALALRSDARSRMMALLPGSVAVLGLLAILFAVSEGAMIGVLAGLLSLGLLIRPLRTLTLGLIIAACLVTVAYAPARNYASLILSLRDDSGSVRKIVWQESLVMLDDHPVFGAGLSGYRDTLLPYHKATHIEIFMYPHDLFLNFWSETGLIGLAGFLWLLAAFFRDNGRLMLREKNGLLPPTLIAAMIAVVVHGLVDVPYFKNDLAMLFWLMAGLTASMMTEVPPKTVKDKLKEIAGQFHFFVKRE